MKLWTLHQACWEMVAKKELSSSYLNPCGKTGFTFGKYEKNLFKKNWELAFLPSSCLKYSLQMLFSSLKYLSSVSKTDLNSVGFSYMSCFNSHTYSGKALSLILLKWILYKFIDSNIDNIWDASIYYDLHLWSYSNSRAENQNLCVCILHIFVSRI